MKQPNIILTGFMGCGKTTVGKLLAKELDYDFIDTDQLIEERCGKTVKEIFRVDGEKIFREMETQIARELGSGEGQVISTGGGLMLHPQNVSPLCVNGRVFCLVATPKIILQRISGEQNGRPLLQTPDPLKKIIELIKDRNKSYQQFKQIDTSEKTPQEIVHDLISLVRS